MTDSERFGADEEQFDGNPGHPGRPSGDEEPSEEEHSSEPQAETETEPEAESQAESSEEAAQTAEQAAEQAQQESDEALFAQFLEEGEGFELPEKGDLREGVIVDIHWDGDRPTEILVNIGAKRDGVVPQSDLQKLPPDFVKDLHEGQKIPVMVTRSDNEEGVLLLSIAEALQQQDWLTAERMLETGEITVRKVVGYNKGGLLVEFGHLRGFIPASHIKDLRRSLSEEERFEEFAKRVGQEVPVKVIEVDRRRRRLVLSQRLAEREYREQQKAKLFKTLKVGDVVKGVVRSLRPFGAFVDIGGADGLLHVSEIGWTPVSHPRDVLKVGDEIEVEILRLDPERNRIALSRKRLLPNPWESIEERYKRGDTVLATITRVVDFGAFARLEPGVEGLIHVSELADITVAEPLKTVKPGDRVAVKILRVDPRRHRIGLSIRQADPEVARALLAAEGIHEAGEEEASEEGPEQAPAAGESEAPAQEAGETEETAAAPSGEAEAAPVQEAPEAGDNGLVASEELPPEELPSEEAAGAEASISAVPSEESRPEEPGEGDGLHPDEA